MRKRRHTNKPKNESGLETNKIQQFLSFDPDIQKINFQFLFRRIIFYNKAPSRKFSLKNHNEFHISFHRFNNILS